MTKIMRAILTKEEWNDVRFGHHNRTHRFQSFAQEIHDENLFEGMTILSFDSLTAHVDDGNCRQIGTDLVLGVNGLFEIGSENGCR
jgi:hypothetical protein